MAFFYSISPPPSEGRAGAASVAVLLPLHVLQSHLFNHPVSSPRIKVASKLLAKNVPKLAEYTVVYWYSMLERKHLAIFNIFKKKFVIEVFIVV